VSVEEIKKSLIALSPAEQGEVTAFLFELRHAGDPEYQERLNRIAEDKNPAHWLTPEEFERRLDSK